MARGAHPSEDAAPGPLSLAVRYLKHRGPASMMLDAIIVMAAYLIVSHVWSAYVSLPRSNSIGQPSSLFEALVTPAAFSHSLSSGLYYLAWFLAVWAAARLLADAVGSAGPRRVTESDDSESE
jgi:hypothetical protein